MQHKASWLSSFYLEPRFLGLCRVFIGVILLVEYYFPFSEIPVWYSDFGVVPIEALRDQYPLLTKFNLFAYFEGAGFLYSFFGLFLASICLFIFGFHTRLATILISFCLYQLYLRNPYINSGGDEILRTQMLILIFLRPGECFSIDAALRRGKEGTNKFFRYPIWHFVYSLQLLAIYFFSAVMKSSPQWWKEFTALEYALSLDLFVSNLGKVLLSFPNLMNLFSGMTFYGEWLLPVFFILVKFLPFKKIKVVGINGIVLFFIFLHISIILTMNIGHFPWICISLWLPLFSPGVYDWLFRSPNKRSIKICYDGNCLFCRKGVHILCHFLGFEVNKTITTQFAHPKMGQMMIDQHSWVVQIGEKYFFHYNAYLMLLRNHPNWLVRFLFIPFFIFKPIGDKLYKIISHKRSFMGSLLKFIKFYEERTSKKKMSITIVGGLYFFLMTYINFLQLNPHAIDKILPNTYYSVFGLSQNWNMFAPNPRNRDEWILILDEKELNEIRNFSKDKKEFFENMGNKKWKKIYFTMFENPSLRPWFIKFYCRQNQLKGMQYLVYFYQENYLNRQESQVISEVKASTYCDSY